jgi:hypothetical protein
MTQKQFNAGQWVEIRSKEEILRTLDKNGQLEKMPFMPEMLKYAGQRLQVSKRAHKTCDPVWGLDSRRLPNAVHLGDTRCDGSAHAGCQAGCLFFWKNEWLKPVDGPSAAASAPAPAPAAAGAGCTEDDLTRGTVSPEPSPEPVYVCQATQVHAATTTIKWWDVRTYIEDLRSGNTSVRRLFNAFAFWVFYGASNLGLGFGSALRGSYDAYQKLIGGSPYPWRAGTVPKGARTPALTLDIQEGDVVKTRAYREILDTLDHNWRNRGLYFDAEMVPFTGGREFKVLKRVDRIIDEKSGRMLKMKNPCLILDGVVCDARYAKCRKLCPRAYYLYWRDIWVEKVSEAPRG